MSNSPHIEIGQYSSKGRKERNDDSYGVLIPDEPLLTSKGIAMAIADGMSTSIAAKEASESCVKSFLTDYYATHESWTVKTSVARILTAVNRWLYGQGQTQYLSDRGMVTTFSGIIIKAGHAHIFHAGDTRISLLRGGSMEPLTTDHRTKVSRTEDYLSRAFGIDPELTVDCKVQELQNDDILIFTSDGVHDYISQSDTIKLIEQHKINLDQAAKTICDQAFEQDSPDNLTTQIVKIVDIGLKSQGQHSTDIQILPFPPDLNPGDMFEGYAIIRQLHASNKSQLYLVKDSSTDKMYALKTPSVNFEDDVDYIEHFTREAWIGRSLSSPHIVKIIAPEKAPQYLYHLMEHVEGETLNDWMNRNPEPSLFEVRQIISQIVIGLRAFHRREILHQDLKPDNIIIDNNGTVKIIDFGSAHVGGLEEHIKQDFNKRGTVNFIAPEYHHQGQATSNRSDIYSLGVLAYLMLTGKLPYGQGFTNKRQTQTLAYIPAHKIRDDIPFWMSKALQKALEKSPINRYDTLSAFERDLSHPNMNFRADKSLPLIEKDPVSFWRTTALFFALLSLILALKGYIF